MQMTTGSLVAFLDFLPTVIGVPQLFTSFLPFALKRFLGSYDKPAQHKDAKLFFCFGFACLFPTKLNVEIPLLACHTENMKDPVAFPF
jgi:hypothetical protein